MKNIRFNKICKKTFLAFFSIELRDDKAQGCQYVITDYQPINTQLESFHL